MRRIILAAALATASAAARPADAPSPAAAVVMRWPAEEARQGVAVDARFFYAVANNAVGKYDRRTGRRVARWDGPRTLFPHMNSCTVDRTELVCAASNYPEVPMASVVEVFDTRTLRHLRSTALPPYPGSLTWLERRGRDWYAMFANYAGERGGEPGHDTRWTVLLRLDERFRAVQSWRLPPELLARLAPMSSSGGSWGADGLLYLTGHDAAEVYALRLPSAGVKLELVATIAMPTAGQAIAWDRAAPRLMWSIDRKTKSVVASRLPPVVVPPVD